MVDAEVPDGAKDAKDSSLKAYYVLLRKNANMRNLWLGEVRPGAVRDSDHCYISHSRSSLCVVSYVQLMVKTGTSLYSWSLPQQLFPDQV